MFITEYSHLSQNGSCWTEAFSAAVADLEKQGGGVLTVPAGVYPTGSIQLVSNMTLSIESGATLLFARDENAYPLIPLEFEGIPNLAHRPCLYAQDAENVIVTGYGTLDGQGNYWWAQVRAKTLRSPRPYLVCFNRCRHVVLENVTLKNSPVWTVHPLRCENMTIRGLNIKNPADSPNTDGIDPNSCRNLRILDCTIDVGDDCIAVKSGTEDTPDRLPTEHVIIANCHFLHGHGGVVLGSEMSGSIRDVVVSSCIFYETDRGIRLKTRRGRGGIVEGIQLFNLTMEKVMCPFVFNMYYFCGKDGRSERVQQKTAIPADETTPALRDVRITGVTARKCGACAGFFYGLPEQYVEGIPLSDVRVEMDPEAEPGTPAMMNDCPKMLRAGFFLRNARGVKLDAAVTNVDGPLYNVDDSVEMLEDTKA